MNITLPDNAIVVVGDRSKMIAAYGVGILLVLVVLLLSWTTAASIRRQEELLDRAEAAEFAAASCQNQVISAAFDRAAVALEMHASPRLVIDPDKKNRRCELP